jgi:protein-S-isoprenylcysteine O-methyltransferase Ste14
MTVGRCTFAACYTLYILVALWFEERDLLAQHGAAYADYRARVPKLLPLPVRRPRSRVTA